MVLLTTTPQILSILSSLPPSALSTLTSTTTQPPSSDETTEPQSNSTPDLKSTNPPLPTTTTTTTPISHHTLIALSHLRTHHPQLNIPTLNTLLHGTQPYNPPKPPKPPPTPEYVALMAHLRAEQEARVYARMVTQQRRNDISLGLQDEEQDPISPSLVLNILLSVVMCAVAAFQMTKWWPSDAARVLVSLATAVVVGLAEVGVYSIYLYKVRTARDKERNMKERKVVIGEWVPEGEADVVGKVGGTANKAGEKEEIWGRGVNGGMRRRVREKWEREQEKNDGEEF